MPPTRKAAALLLGLSAMLTVATIAQAQKPGQSPGDATLVIEEATVDWFQKSDVSALREGVLDKVEQRIGSEVAKGGEIGRLHKRVADLAVEEAKIQAEGVGAIEKAKAQKGLALTVVARNKRLLTKGRDMVSMEDAEKAEAELAAADASLIEAKDTQKLAVAKLESAKQAADEHIIRAPFSGQILEEFRHEGESVRSNEPVVRLGNLDQVRVWAYIPLEYAYRVAPGTEISIQVRLGDRSTGKHAIEQKAFRGKISSVDQSIQPIADTAVRIFADLDNPNHELRPGLKASMTIMLKPEGVGGFASPRQHGGQPTGIGARSAELPPLPR